MKKNVMKRRSPYEISNYTSRQAVFRISWKLKVHYRVHKFPPLVLNLSQINSICTLQSQFLKTYFYILLRLRSSIPSGLLHHTSLTNTDWTSRLPASDKCRPSDSPSFEEPNNLRRRPQIMKFLNVEFSPPAYKSPFLRPIIVCWI